MPKKYRLGVAAMVHDHVWGELAHWAALPNVELVAAGDVNEELRTRIHTKFNVPKLYNSWREMLKNEQLDIVLAASENNVCADIVEDCAARGIHVVSEKPMAATYQQALRMKQAAERHNIHLLINWPTAWSPAIQEMERRILAGEIGSLFYFNQRSAHNGPMEIGCDPHFWKWLYDEEKNGAGALMDYCCYSADMCARFLGVPLQVTGVRAVLVKDYPIPDDNAIILMQYAHALGLAEASWTQTVGTSGPNPMAYGTGGSLAVMGNTVVLHQTGKDPVTITAAKPEPPRQNAGQYLLHCLETGSPIEGFCSAEVSCNAQMILEAGKRAADTGVTVTLPL